MLGCVGGWVSAFWTSCIVSMSIVCLTQFMQFGQKVD